MPIFALTIVTDPLLVCCVSLPASTLPLVVSAVNDTSALTAFITGVSALPGSNSELRMPFIGPLDQLWRSYVNDRGRARITPAQIKVNGDSYSSPEIGDVLFVPIDQPVLKKPVAQYNSKTQASLVHLAWCVAIHWDINPIFWIAEIAAESDFMVIHPAPQDNRRAVGPKQLQYSCSSSGCGNAVNVLLPIGANETREAYAKEVMPDGSSIISQWPGINKMWTSGA